MGRAQAQAVAQKTAAITNQDSFQLVKCLIRVSVYHVCWMRGLFPEEAFTGHDLAQLDQLHVKMLEPDQEDDEASTLKNWVEQGVIDAVAKGYLKNMYFGIAQDAAATNLLEEYIYSFKYGAEGVEFEMSAAAHGKKKDKYNSKAKERGRPGVDDVRYQVVRLMRMLVQLCQTLDKVPEQRYLFIKLTYHDHTPDDYEPPYFHGVAEEGIGHFHRRPFSMDVGAMDTHHHMVSVRVKSVLDSVDDEEYEGPADDAMKELQASQQMVPVGEGNNNGGGGELDMADAAGGEDEEEETAAMTAAAHEMSCLHNSARARAEDDALALLTATEDQTPDDDLMMDIDTDEAAAAAAQQQRSAKGGGGGGAPGLQLAAASQDDTHLTDDHMDQAGGGEGGGSDGAPSGQGVYEAVRSFCLTAGRSTVSYVDLMTAFYQVDESQLGRALDGLMREGLLAQAGPQRDTYNVLQQQQHHHHHTNNDPTTSNAAAAGGNSEGMMAEAAGAGSGGSCDAAGGGAAGGDNSKQQQNCQHRQQQKRGGRGGRAAAAAAEDDAMLTNQMSGLSVGAGAAAAAAGARKARGMAGVDASVYGAAMRAGSLMTGQPEGGAPGMAPTAATTQADRAAAAGDEPSVQLQADQQQGLWIDASQQSFQGPNPAAAAGAGAAAAGPAAAGAAVVRTNSRLRKASYVNSPIHQHPGKRGPGSRLHKREQREQREAEMEKENEGGAEADTEAEGDGNNNNNHQQQQQQGVAAAAKAVAGGGGGEMKAPRKKVAVRKPKKPAAATAAAVGTPTRGGRMPAMRG